MTKCQNEITVILKLFWTQSDRGRVIGDFATDAVEHLTHIKIIIASYPYVCVVIITCCER